MSDPGKVVRLVFEVSPDFPTRYASHLVVQHDEHDFTLTFFDLRPPLLVGTEENKRSTLDQIEDVRAVPVGRIVVAASRMPEFVQVLQDNLRTHLRSKGERE